MRRLLAAALAATLLIVLAAPALAKAPPVKRTKLGNFYFSPGHVTIKRGTKVVWHFLSGYHDVTVRRGPVKFTSGGRLAGSSFSHIFKKPGTYHLYCKIHPVKMTETIIVK